MTAAAAQKGHAVPFCARGRNAFRHRMLQRHLRGGTDNHPLIDMIGAALLEHIALVRHPFKRVLVLGWPGETFLRALDAQLQPEQFVVADVALDLETSAHRRSPSRHHPQSFRHVEGFAACLTSDLEQLPFAPNSFDVVVNMLTLHLTNDVPGVLRQLNVMLRPDGLLVAACFGGESLQGLRQEWIHQESELFQGVVSRFPPLILPQQGAMLMQRAGFKVSLSQVDRVPLNYDNVASLLSDIHHYGQWAPLKERAAGMGTPQKIKKIMSKMTRKLENTVEVIYLSGRAPAPEQQKPQLPGRGVLPLGTALEAL
ncbi:class I SAM-dependent methyltransferase [Alphaproteobacteria bacterium]|nr:class I SAM-dependent methyltransferase [Alphaproteobacteria bacterium]